MLWLIVFGSVVGYNSYIYALEHLPVALVSIYTYRTAFKFFEFGRGGAIAVVMMLINFTLAMGYLIALRRQKAAS